MVRSLVGGDTADPSTAVAVGDTGGVAPAGIVIGASETGGTTGFCSAAGEAAPVGEPEGGDDAVADDVAAGTARSAWLPNSRERAGSVPSIGDTTTIDTRRFAALLSVVLFAVTG